MASNSFFDWLKHEIEVHKWILSEKAQQDLGVSAIEDWFENHFHKFIRARLFEHITGRNCYSEFNREAFNIVQNHKCCRLPSVGEKILEMLRRAENLEIVNWSTIEVSDKDVRDDLADLLTKIDVNFCHDYDRTVKPQVVAACG